MWPRSGRHITHRACVRDESPVVPWRGDGRRFVVVVSGGAFGLRGRVGAGSVAARRPTQGRAFEDVEKLLKGMMLYTHTATATWTTVNGDPVRLLRYTLSPKQHMER